MSSPVLVERPALLVVPTFGELKRLTESLEDPSLPVIDVEVLLGRAIDGLICKSTVMEEIDLLGGSIMSLDEDICHCLRGDADNVESGVLEKTTLTTIALMNNVLSNMISNDMYDGDFLHYEFARIADNDNLLLRRVGRPRW